MKNAEIKFLFFFVFIFIGPLAKADVTYFKGTITFDSSDPQKPPMIPKVNVTVKISTTAPAPGTATNQSHVTTDGSGDGAKKSVICEYHYTFTPPQVTMTVTTDNGTVIGSANVDATVTGVIYTDSPSSPDVTQCQAPAAGKFPVTGPLDITLGAIKNFQLADNLLLSIDPGKQTFKNEATLDLKSQDPNSPQLSSLVLSSMEKLKWSTFGTDTATKTGTLDLAPSQVE